MYENEGTACIIGPFVSWRIGLRTLQRELIGGHLSIRSYQSSLFSSAGTFLCLLLPLTYDRPTITSGRLARACTRCSLTSAGSRRSFVFGLIGCIIWDTSSGVKPSEEAWEASALGWGWGMGAGHFEKTALLLSSADTSSHPKSFNVLRKISCLISCTYFVLMRLFRLIFSFRKNLFTQINFHSFLSTMFVVCHGPREGDFLFVSLLVCGAANSGLTCCED